MDKIDFSVLSYTESIKKLNSSINGLTEEEAGKRIKKFGQNIFESEKNKSSFSLFFKQFNNYFVFILLIAVAISFLVQKHLDAIVILSIIFLNALIGFLQEKKAEKAVQSLKKLLVPKTKVYRNSNLVLVDSSKIVPGDIVLYEAGDKVTADTRIIEETNIKVLESIITGESFPIEKSADVLKSNTGKLEKTNILWAGTLVSTGRALGVVFATGENTILGEIALSLKNVKKGKNAIQILTKKLSLQMALIAILGTSFIFFLTFFNSTIPKEESLVFSIASLVSAIPEGLPAMITVVLAVGAYRLSRKNVIIKTLDKTLTLSAVNFIATDKTGTLTLNEMKVDSVFFNNGMFLDYKDLAKIPVNNEIKNFFENLMFCNNVKKIKDQNSNSRLIGDPTEISLLEAAITLGIKTNIRKNVIFDLAFDTQNKFRATLVKYDQKKKIIIIGAPEKIIQMSFSYNPKAEEFLKKSSSEGKRVVALAESIVENNMQEITLPVNLKFNFLGLITISDPLRDDAKEAVFKAKKAGIDILMMTGDHKETALNIAKRTQIIDESTSSQVITGEDMEKMTNNELSRAIFEQKIRVFARVSPEQKLRLAKVLKQNDVVLAMTGDGVNDAPALKQSDVGIAMNLSGTDTAKESSDLILVDDNFSNIIKAIEEGRVVYNNIKRSATFLVTTNIAEQITLLITIFLGLPLPLLASQILFLNLVTDGINAFALGFEKTHNTALSLKPFSLKQGIIGKDTIVHIITMSLIMFLLSFTLFTSFYKNDLDFARTTVFLAMAFTQQFNALNLRSLTKTIFKIGLFTNKIAIYSFLISTLITLLVVLIYPLNIILGFSSIDFLLIVIIFSLSSLVLILGSIQKIVVAKFLNKK